MIYTYDSSSINFYSTSDYGSIASSPSSNVDSEFLYLDLVLTSDFIVNQGTDYIVDPVLSTSDYGYIVFTDTAYPFGSLKVLNSSKNSTTSIFISSPAEPLRLRSSAATSKKSVWVGNGTLFEIGGGQLLTAFAWLASSGPLRVSGNSKNKAIYSYNDSSIEAFDSLNYGLVSNASINNFNYESVSDTTGGSITDYGYIINAELYPYGSFAIKGSSKESISTGTYKGSGSLFASGGEANAKVVSVKSETRLFRISGAAVGIQKSFGYNGSGFISSKGNKQEKTTFNYNTSSIEYFENFNYGSIVDLSSNQNYGFIAIESYGEYDYNFIVNNKTTYPFGTLSFSGSVAEEFKPTFGQKGSGSLIIQGRAETKFFPSYNTFGLFKVSNQEQNSFARKHFGSGNLFTIGSKQEKVTYNYNQSSIEYFDVLDYQFITASGSTVDYGLITSELNEEFDYGTIVFNETVFPYQTSFKVTGSSSQSISTGTYKGSGSLLISGSATSSQVDFGKSETQLFKISGAVSVNIQSSYNAFVYISNIGSKEEKVTYSYNQSSIEYFDTLDYQFITASGSTVDYGLIINETSSLFDYGNFEISQITYPFGTLSFSGSVVEEFKPTFGQRGFAELKIHGTASSKFFPSYNTFGLFKVSNQEQNSFARGYFGSGFISNIGSKEEKVTYSYNQSSIEYFDTLDYQFITASGSTVDYGLVIDDSNPVIDYGSIEILQTTYPFGTLSFSGSVVEEFKPTFGQIGFAELKIHGTAESKFFPSYNTFGLFKVSNQEQNSFTKGYFGSGFISNIGSKEEKVTYNYNQSSIAYFNTLDYQFITASGTTVDYGLVIDDSNPVIDYGTIVFNETVFPYQTSFKISGSSSESISTGTYEGSGSLFVSGGEANAKVISNPSETQLFRVSGGASVNIQSSYSAFGYISSIGSKEENVVFSYNISSIEYFNTFDYQFITASGSTVDYGLIISELNEEFNYGSIEISQTTYPFGTLSFSGSVVEEFKPTFGQRGFALLTIQGAAEDKFFPSYNTFGLFNISGSSKTTFVRGSYESSGTLFTIGSKEEKVTYNYNQSSVEYFDTLDYQFITASGTTIDYGLITSELNDEFDYGSIEILQTTYPFGSFNLIGVSEQSFTKGSYTGSGSLFTFNGLVESRAVNLPATGLFKVSGSAIEKNTESFVGSGSLFTIGSKKENVVFSYNTSSIEYFDTLDYQFITASGSTSDYGLIIDESSTENNYGNIIDLQTNYPFGSFNLIGASEQSFTKGLYTGSGYFSAIGGESNVYTRISKSETQLFKLSGNSTVNAQSSYNSSGSLFTIGSKKENVVFSYNTSSIAYFNTLDYQFITASGTTVDYGLIIDESSTENNYGNIIDLQTNYPFGSFNIFGKSEDKWIQSFVEVGSGSLKISGTSDDDFVPGSNISTVLLRVSGSAIVIAPRTYEANGSLFTVGSKTERFTFHYNTSSVDPYDEINYGIITSSGTTVDYGTVSSESYSEFDYGVIVNIRFEYPFGSLNLSGGVKYDQTRYIPHLTGRGTLFAVGGESHAYSRKSVTETQLFRVSGSAIEKNTESFVGSGRIFGFNGLVESKAVNPPATGLFKIAGVAGAITSSKSKVYTGTGSITVQSAIYPEYLSYRPTPRYVISSGNIFSSGQASTRYFAVYTNVGSGTKFISGSAIESHTESYRGFAREFVYGTSVEKRTKIYNGFGSFFTISGLTESRTANPTEDTALFKIFGSGSQRKSGTYYGLIKSEVSGSSINSRTSIFTGTIQSSINGFISEKSSVKEVGVGSLFTFGGLTESTTANPTEDTALFNISGQASTRYFAVYTNVGSGTKFISGNARAAALKSYNGSGSLFTFNGVTESVSINTITRTADLVISGKSSQAFNRIFTGSGTEFISGSSTNSKLRYFIGSGSVFTFTGSSESISYSASPETILFAVSGSANISANTSYIGSGFTSVQGTAGQQATVSYVGSGSEFITGSSSVKSSTTYFGTGRLFAYKGLSESIANVPETTGLFKVSGKASDSFIRSAYQGSGTLFNTGNSAESIVVNPPEDIALFKISGSGSVISAVTHTGFGSEYVSGKLVQKVTNNFKGTGRIFTFFGSSESTIFNPPEDTILFKISGEASNIKRSSSEITSGTFSYNGNLSERKTNSIKGFGTLFAVGSAAETRTIESISGTTLFKINVNSKFAYSRISVFNGCEINVSGQSFDYPILSSPARIFATII